MTLELGMLERKMSLLTRYTFQRFPKKKEYIWRLSLRNAEFRSICEDYGKCIEAIEYWNKSNDSDAGAKVEEYRYLCEELEKEILQVIGDHIEIPKIDRNGEYLHS